MLVFENINWESNRAFLVFYKPLKVLLFNKDEWGWGRAGVVKVTHLIWETPFCGVLFPACQRKQAVIMNDFQILQADDGIMGIL